MEVTAQGVAANGSAADVARVDVTARAVCAVVADATALRSLDRPAL